MKLRRIKHLPHRAPQWTYRQEPLRLSIEDFTQAIRLMDAAPVPLEVRTFWDGRQFVGAYQQALNDRWLCGLGVVRINTDGTATRLHPSTLYPDTHKDSP